MVAADGSSAAGLMDLLTVVAHEIGHVLGYSDLSSDGTVLMDADLEAGVRLLPESELSLINAETVMNEVDTTTFESSPTVTNIDNTINTETTDTVTDSSVTDTANTDSATTDGATLTASSDTNNLVPLTVTDETSLTDTSLRHLLKTADF